MPTEAQKWYASITAIFLWFVIAVLVDRFVILPHIPALSNVLYLRNLELAAEPFKRTFDRLGLFVLLVVPWVLGSIALVPFLKFRRGKNWKDAFVLSAASAFWFILIPVFIWAGHIAYKMFSTVFGDVKYLKPVFAFCETFTFKCSIYVFGRYIADLDASFAALLFAGVGILVAYRQGIWKPWLEKR